MTFFAEILRSTVCWRQMTKMFKIQFWVPHLTPKAVRDFLRQKKTLLLLLLRLSVGFFAVVCLSVFFVDVFVCVSSPVAWYASNAYAARCLVGFSFHSSEMPLWRKTEKDNFLDSLKAQAMLISWNKFQISIEFQYWDVKCNIIIVTRSHIWF